MSYFAETLIFTTAMLFVYFITSKLSSRLDKIVTLVFIGIFLYIITSRPYSVPDTSNYYRFFTLLDGYKLHFTFGRSYLGFENGFCNLSKIIFLISQNFRIYLFAIGFLSFSISFSALLKIGFALYNHKTNWFELFMLYVPYYGFLYSGIVLRAGLAIGFCLYSFYFLIKRRFLVAFVFLALGVWFHNSALIFLVVFIFFLLPKTFSNHSIYKLSILVFLLYILKIFDLLVLLFLQIINQIISKTKLLSFMTHYLDTEIASSFRLAVVFLLLLYMFCTYINLIATEKNVLKYQNLIFYLMLITAVSGGLPVALRGLDYFSVLLLPSIAAFVSKNNKNGIFIERFVIFSTNDAWVLKIIILVLVSMFYFLFIRVASLI